MGQMSRKGGGKYEEAFKKTDFFANTKWWIETNSNSKDQIFLTVKVYYEIEESVC